MHFTIDSEEGLPIRGNIHRPSDPRALVVLVHGFKGFKDWGFFPYVAESLCDAGYAVCRFNMSRSGIGEDDETFDRLDLFAGDTYSKQLADLRAIIAYAHGQFPFLPLFILGHSRGGAIALLGAQHVPHLRGVITWSAISNADRWDDATKAQWRRDGHYDVLNARTKQTMRMSCDILDDYEANSDSLDVEAAVARLRCPLLVIHGGKDESVPVSEAATIASHGRDVAHVVLEGASHTYDAIHPLVNVPFSLSMAVTLTSKFIAAHTETRTVVVIDSAMA